MSRILTVASIRRPAADVFNYVTTPGNWPAWHPSSVRVTGAIDHPLDVGERCVEEYVVAGRPGVTEWIVHECVPASRWVIETRPRGGGSGTITYTLSSNGAQTTFERLFVYEMPNVLLSLLDRFVLRRRIEAESEEATRRLKALLEREPTP